MRGVRVKGDVIRDLRTGLGLTQDQLATQAKVDARTIRNAEATRRLDIRTVAAITTALGCEYRELSDPSGILTDKSALHLDIVLNWHEAILAADINALRRLYTEDSILDVPGAEGLPIAGDIHGRDALRAQLFEFFQLFRVTSVRDDDFLVHAVDEYVFLRTTATIEYLPAGKSFTARHLNEFEFREGLIARQVNIADWGGLRKIVEK
jgi:transcriptional regulator with XRE-family HTH domain